MFPNMQVLHCNHFISYPEVKDKSKQLSEGPITVNTSVPKYSYTCKSPRQVYKPVITDHQISTDPVQPDSAMFF